MGNLACDVLFRMPARDVTRYTLFKVTSIDELDARTSSCNDSETALTNPIHPNGWDHYLFLTKHWPSGRDSNYSRWHTRKHFLIVCCDTYSFYSQKYQPRKKRERESCGKWDDHLGEREWNKLKYSDLQHNGFVQSLQRKSCKSHVFIFLLRHPMRKIKPPYI